MKCLFNRNCREINAECVKTWKKKGNERQIRCRVNLSNHSNSIFLHNYKVFFHYRRVGHRSRVSVESSWHQLRYVGILNLCRRTQHYEAFEVDPAFIILTDPKGNSKIVCLSILFSCSFNLKVPKFWDISIKFDTMACSSKWRSY